MGTRMVYALVGSVCVFGVCVCVCVCVCVGGGGGGGGLYNESPIVIVLCMKSGFPEVHFWW